MSKEDMDEIESPLVRLFVAIVIGLVIGYFIGAVYGIEWLSDEDSVKVWVCTNNFEKFLMNKSVREEMLNSLEAEICATEEDQRRIEECTTNFENLLMDESSRADNMLHGFGKTILDRDDMTLKEFKYLYLIYYPTSRQLLKAQITKSCFVVDGMEEYISLVNPLTEIIEKANEFTTEVET